MRIALIVEGEGEVAALPALIRNIAAREDLDVTLVGRPYRLHRNRVTQAEHLHPAVTLLGSRADAVLVLMDADDDCAVELAGKVRAVAEQVVTAGRVHVVCAVREFEAWFLAAAESLRGVRGIPLDFARPPSPEAVRGAKEQLRHAMNGRYSPTIDQPALAALMDPGEAGQHARSFRKLLTELRTLGAKPTPGS